MNAKAGKNMTVTLRAMTPADLDRIAEMEQAIFGDPWPRSVFDDMFADCNWHGLIAEENGEIVGYACYLLVAAEVQLANIAVAEPFRRKSVAKQVLDHIFLVARREVCDSILLEVRPSNQAARKFYEKAGFVQLYRRPAYYTEPKEDAIVMHCLLNPEATAQ